MRESLNHGIYTLSLCKGHRTLYTGIVHCLKVPIAPLSFYERPVSVPVFANWKFQRGFLLLPKKVKSENSTFSICFVEAVVEAACTLSNKSSTAVLLPGNHTQHLNIKAAIALNCLWASVLYLDFCVHLLARCALNYQIKLRWFFGSGKAQKVFHVNKW